MALVTEMANLIPSNPKKYQQFVLGMGSSEHLAGTNVAKEEMRTNNKKDKT